MLSLAIINSIWKKSLLLPAKKSVRYPSLLLLMLATLFVAYIARLQPITHDAFHEMALAREWFRTGDFPQNDVFAFTPTVQPTVHHEWGTGVLLYFGSLATPDELAGIGWMKWTLVAALWVMLYRVARQRGAHPALFVLASILVFPMLWVGFATLRAGLFTLVAIAAQVLMQQADLRGNRRWICLWIPLYLIWLNLHAGFVVGLAMIGMHGVERSIFALNESHPWKNSANISTYLRLLPWRSVIANWIRTTWHLLALLPVIFLGLLCNPWGSEYFPYLVRAILMPRPDILEWKPLWHTNDPLVACSAMFASLAVLIYAIRCRSWHQLSGVFICSLAAWMAIKHIRHGAIYSVLWIAFVPAWLTPTSIGKSIIQFFRRNETAITFSSVGISAIALAFSLWQPFYQTTLPVNPQASSSCYPKQAADYLENTGFQGNLFVPFHAGSYISWRLYPKVKVSIDGRYEVAYREDVLPDHLSLYRNQEGWSSVLNKYEVSTILVPEGSKIRETLEHAGWRQLHRDHAYSIFQRDMAKP